MIYNQYACGPKRTQKNGENERIPISRFCLSTKPDMIGNMCRLDLEELFTCGSEVLLGRFRIFTELNEGDVFAESDNFTWAVISGALITMHANKYKIRSISIISL